jgi:FkbM family methyltransferase
MSDSKHKTSAATHARAILKRVPGSVAAVRNLRTLKQKTLIGAISRILKWLMRTPGQRMLVFDALPDQLVLAGHARESYIVHTSDRIIGRSLYWRGDFDFQKFEAANRLLREHWVVGPDAPLPVLIDVGANVGSICIPAVKRELVNRCIAIEPDPENFRLLKVNAALNGVDDRIDTRQMAVGATSDRVSVLRSASNFGDHRVRAVTDKDEIIVPMITLDTIAGELDLQHTVLWMDIQGYEGYALQGANRFLAAGVPLITEFSREELAGSGCFEIFLSVIASSSYRVFFDLAASHPQPVPVSFETLRALSDRLDQQKIFTDLLFLPAKTDRPR